MCKLRVNITTHVFTTVLGGETFIVPANPARRFLQTLNQSDVNWLYAFGGGNPQIMLRPDVEEPQPLFTDVVPQDEVKVSCADANRTIFVLEGQEP